MSDDLFEGVRQACAAVARQAQHVHLNTRALPTYARTLPMDRLAHPEHDAATHYLGHGEGTAAFFLTLDAINFGSGYFPHLAKRPGMSGYFTVASSLNDRFRKSGPFSAKELSELTPAGCTVLFGQDPENQPIQELMALFSRALGDLGRLLLRDYGGSFAALLEAGQHSAKRLAALLIQMPYFDDVSCYGGLRVPFYKRAQLTAADLSIAFDGKGLGRFDDLQELTIFADNLVPHVLHVDGVLRYEPELESRIERGELLSAGSAEEVEVRACALHAVEVLSAELREGGQAIWPMQLDYLLWNRGQQPAYKAKPRHRARTTFY